MKTAAMVQMIGASLLLSIMVAPAQAQVSPTTGTDLSPSGQSGDRRSADTLSGDAGLSNMFELFHRLNMGIGRSSSDFSQEQQDQIGDAASDFRARQMEQLRQRGQTGGGTAPIPTAPTPNPPNGTTN